MDFTKIQEIYGGGGLDIDKVEKIIYDSNSEILKLLLSDKTTKKYIRWGNDNYIEYGPEYHIDQEIKPELIIGSQATIIQPRVWKSEQDQNKRTKDKAEVFTPSWVCNEQNNLVDAAWFGRKDVFNVAGNKTWISNKKKIEFSGNKIWKDYVDARRMEISCGEAPYLVSRYDTVTGQIIPLKERIGFLDRKLRIVNENAADSEEWMEWTIRAFQSCYGYDFSGDNIFLARENLFYTFIEYAEAYTGKIPNFNEQKRIANIIAWNIWQMNGLTMTVPYSESEPMYEQLTFFNLLGVNEDKKEKTMTDEIPCKIFDWRSNKSIEFQTMIREG